MLTEIVSNYYSSIQIATVLLEHGLVTKTVNDCGHTTTWWEITDKGRSSAELLREAENPSSLNALEDLPTQGEKA